MVRDISKNILNKYKMHCLPTVAVNILLVLLKIVNF